MGRKLSKLWRPLNLQLAPFSFPKPLRSINEQCAEMERVYADESLGIRETSA